MKKSTLLATIILFSLLQNAQALDTNLEWDNYGIPWHRNSQDEDGMEGIDWQALGDETNPIHDDGYGSNQDEDYDIDPQDLGDANPTDEDDEDEDIPTIEGFDYSENHLADDQDEEDDEDEDDIDEESLANNGWVIVEKSDADGYDQ